MNRQDMFARLSQSIVDAARPENEEQEEKSQKKAALVVNAVGSMVTDKKYARTVRMTDFSNDANFLADAIQRARAAKQPAKPEAVKSLAALLAESAQDSDE